MATSQYLREKLTAATYNGVAFTPPTNFYLALYTLTGPVGLDPTMHELTGGNYSRVEWFPTVGTEPEWTVSNNEHIIFPTASLDWDIVTHLGIIDNLGNLLDHGPIITPRTIYAGGVFRVLIGELDIQYK